MIGVGDDSIVHEMAAACKAMADRNRFRIIRVLLSRNSESLSVTDLANILNISQPLASQHIKAMKAVGLVNARREGNRMLYSINMNTVTRYVELFFDLYVKAHKPCPHGLRCGDCPVKTTCA